MRPTFRFAAALCAFTAAAVQAADAGGLRVERAWARATAPGAGTAAAYFRIANAPDRPADKLIGASSAVAASAELHTHREDGGVMRMRPVSVLPIAPGQIVEARPGGLHVMLLGLKEPLVAGREFTLSLKFEQAGTLAVPVRIEPIDYVPAGEHHHH